MRRRKQSSAKRGEIARLFKHPQTSLASVRVCNAVQLRWTGPRRLYASAHQIGKRSPHALLCLRFLPPHSQSSPSS
ncbi:hypothetical protein GBA52_018301 [Prunus armeniaca]|nr:hypothetical protein GBA52_018301 [Prunus armeniaca]